MNRETLLDQQQIQETIEQEGDSWDGKYHGLDIKIRRHPTLLHLCGYVQVPERNSLFGKGYWDADLDVHGGLTYAGGLGEDDRWFLGFDCAHAYDISPGLGELLSYESDYRDMEYVKKECKKLAEQIDNFDKVREE